MVVNRVPPAMGQADQYQMPDTGIFPLAGMLLIAAGVLFWWATDVGPWRRK